MGAGLHLCDDNYGDTLTVRMALGFEMKEDAVLNRRSFALMLLGLGLVGCGGGKGVSNRLFTLRTGMQWVYRVTGTVDSNSLQNGSTLTVSVPAGTVKDANGQDVNILERKYDLILPDGRHVVANQRLYWSQTSQGIFVHGVNFHMGDITSPANDVFVSATADSPFRFLYIADPAVNGLSINYVKPMGGTADTLYSLVLGSRREIVTVPAGSFSAKALGLQEKLRITTHGDLLLSGAAFSPGTGILSAVIDAMMPDGSELHGVILLTSFKP